MIIMNVIVCIECGFEFEFDEYVNGGDPICPCCGYVFVDEFDHVDYSDPFGYGGDDLSGSGDYPEY
jgi:hypothetical protein